MHNARQPPPDPGRTAFTAHPGFRSGRWLVAVPAHLTMVGGVLAAAFALAPSAPVAESAPMPPAAAVGPTTPPPFPSPTPEDRLVTASPEPTERWASSSALAALDGLEVAARGSTAGYDRYARFGDWIDDDGNCVTTRDEILARDLTDVDSDDGCRVESGMLDDPYTGTSISFTRGVTTSSDVQIDHVVAAGNAWASGARSLSQTERVEFYNDPLNLLAVAGAVNASKSDSAADEWLPPEESFHCEYVATQIAVKAKYGLQVTAPEKAAMHEVLSACPDQELPADHRNEDLT
ncbi:HNH endonuclease family protein [Kocuria aegyptia]|uniref:GmrSD restriction endonucleases C-terminal domain-containing protein n=1 Tax=Kocuria aegyptia TaxID=330943 RepID=A0ABN2K7N1_9MICC